jgi:hypothetical protein
MPGWVRLIGRFQMSNQDAEKGGGVAGTIPVLAQRAA